MIVGIMFIIAGILIATHPPLLSIIVASILILIGVTLCSISYRFKKHERGLKDPFTDFFTKF